MGISETLSGFYAKLEDKFYGIADFFDSKGIPVNSAIDWVEDKGIPAFPLTIAAIVVVVALLYGFVFAATQQVTVVFDLKDNNGNALSQVRVSAVNSAGNNVPLGKTSFKDGEDVTLAGVPVGGTIKFSSQKEGYIDGKFSLQVSGTENLALLRMKKDVQTIVGQISLVDTETGDPVGEAQVIATLSDKSTVECNAGESIGAYECVGVLEGDSAKVDVRTSNFEDSSFTVSFFEGSVSEFELQPKASAAEGKSSLIIRVVDSATEQRVQGATIRIFDADDEGLISEVTDEDGEYIERVDKGLSLRVVVSRDGYIKYDSGAEGIERTMRDDEELWLVSMVEGGATVTVRVRDAGGAPLTGVVVSLFNSEAELLDEEKTLFAGEVDFSDLNAEATYFVTAFLDRYVPAREIVRPLQSKELDIELERLTQSNSSNLRVFVVDERNSAVNNAFLNFFELEDGKKTPSGIPQQKSDVTGKATVPVSVNISMLVEAVKGAQRGEAEVEIKQQGLNEALVTVRKELGLVTFALLDEDKEPVQGGHLTIKSGAGEELFRATLSGQNEVTVDVGENDYVKIDFLGTDGKTHAEEIYVKEQSRVEVIIGGKGSASLSPTLEFLGVFSASGAEVEGIKRGQDYFLKFQVVFPEGKGNYGMHVRVGDDSVKFADSQDVGIIGLSATGAQAFYGRTFSPFPEPGFEGVDMQNEGNPGGYNKFVELSFTEGGTKIVKVRVKAKETATDSSFDVKFRAWSEAGRSFYRAPVDSVLETAAFSSEKGTLYAETLKESVRIFQTDSSCEDDLCAGFKFIRSNDSEFAPEDFKAVVGEVYALEVELNPSKEIDATIRAVTSRSNPKIFWQGYGIDNFIDFPDNNKQETSIEVKGITAMPGQAVKTRLFFKTVELETASITLQVVTADDVLNESFFFDIFLERDMEFSIQPDEVTLGKDFSILLKEDTGKGIENATIKLKDKDGKHIETIIGDGSLGKGLDGKYDVKNSFDPGVIKYEIAAEGFKPVEGELQVLKTGVLRLPEEVQVSIPAGQEQASVSVNLENISEELVQDIQFEVKRRGNFPVGMELKAGGVSSIQANSTYRVPFTAAYHGIAEREHGEVDVIARGRVLGKYSVSAETRVKIDFNPEVDPADIEFSKSKLVAYLASGYDNRQFYDNSYNQRYPSGYDSSLYGTGGSSPYGTSQYGTGGTSQYGTDYSGAGYYDSTSYPYSYSNNVYAQRYYPSYLTGYGSTDYSNYNDTLPYRYLNYSSAQQVEFTIRNNSDLDLVLVPDVVAEDKIDAEGIQVDVPQVTLKKKGTAVGGRREDEKAVKVSITNKLLRNYPNKQSFKFDLVFKSDAVTKSIPLEIFIWSPKFALEMQRNVELWLSQETPTSRAIAQVPLFVRNVGLAPVENIVFRASSASLRGNVNVRVIPAVPVPFLDKGQAITPPPALVAEAIRTEKTTLLDVKQIDVFGTIDGRQYEFGPIFVTTHISRPECLVVVPNSLEFLSEKETGAITKELKVKNTCAEEVRVRLIEPREFGSNSLDLAFPDEVVPPGSDRPIQIILTKNEAWNAQTQVFLRGFLVRSGRFTSSNPINVNLNIGKQGVQDKVAVEEISVPVCGEEGKAAEEKLVAFPKIATGNDCSNAYCDAKQLSEFLAEKIRSRIDETKRQVTNYKSDLLNVPTCETHSSGYCSFADLGLSGESFSVYFQNDILSPQLLKEALSGKGADLASYRTDYASGSDPGRFLGQIGKQVLINGRIEGCGRYRMSVNGAVKVQGSQLQPDLMVILIDVNPEGEALDNAEGAAGGAMTGKEVTEQCLPKIQNIANFLPLDEGFTPANRKDTLLGLVDVGGETPEEKQKLEGLGKEVATGMFGNEARFVQNATTSNRLNLQIGETTGYLVKVDIEKTGEGAKKTVKAFIQDAGTNAEKQGKVAKEAAQAIIGLRNNAIDGCISANDDYALLKSAAEVGELEIMACKENKLRISVGESCCDISVLGDLQQEVEAGASIDKVTGINPPQVKKGNAAVTETKLDAKDEKTNKYKSELQLCVTGLTDLHNANGKKVKLDAQYKVTKAKAAAKEVELQVCGLHPSTLLDEVQKQPAGTYYFNPSWKGTPETIQLKELIEGEVAEANLAEAEKSVASNKPGGQTKIEDAKKTQRLRGLGIYVGTCSAVAALAGWWTGFGIFLNPLIDCIIPAAWSGADDIGLGGVKEWISDISGKVFGFLGGITDSLFGKFDDVTEALTGPTDNIENFDELKNSAFTTVSTYSIYRGITNPSDIATASNVRSAAKTVSENLADQIMKDNFPHYPLIRSARSTALWKNLSDKYYNEIVKGAESSYGKSTLDNAVRSATGASHAAVAADSKVVEEFVKLKGNLKPEAQNLLKGNKATVLNEAFDLQKYTGAAEGSGTVKKWDIGVDRTTTPPKYSEKSFKSTAAGIADQLTNDTWPQIRSDMAEKLGAEFVGENEKELRSLYRRGVGAAVRNQLSTPVDAGTGRLLSFSTEFTPANARSSVTAGVENINKNLAGKALEFVEKKAGPKVMQELAQKADEAITSTKGTYSLKWTNFKSYAKGFLKNFGKGIAGGLIANAAGLAAYKAYMNSAGKAVEADETFQAMQGNASDDDGDGLIDEEVADGIDNDGDGKVDEDVIEIKSDITLKKYKPYKVTIREEFGRKTYTIDEAGEGAEIPADAKFIEKCDATLQEDFEVVGSLLPQANEFSGQAPQVASYYKHYSPITRHFSDAFNVPEALLVTVASWKTGMGTQGSVEWITSCNYGSEETKSVEKSFECAARELSTALNSCSGEENSKEKVTCALQKYDSAGNKRPNEKAANFDELFEQFELWNKRKFTIEAS